MRTKLIIRLVFLVSCFSLAAAYAADVDCLSNHAIPPGYGTCKEPDGAVRVGPPPAMARPAVVVAAPGYRPAPIVPSPNRHHYNGVAPGAEELE